MNSEQIRIDAQLISGIPIEAVTSATLVKDGILELARDYFSIGTVTEETIVGNSQLEKEVLKIISVKHDNIPVRYILTGDRDMWFSEAAHEKDWEYVVRYYAMPELPAQRTDELPIPKGYQVALKYYVAFKMRGRIFGQGDASAVSFYQQFSDAALRADVALRAMSNRGRRMPARRY